MRGDGPRLSRMRETLLREARVLTDVAGALDESAEIAVDLLLRTRGHILTGGAGTSSAIAARLAHLLSCCGAPAVLLHPADSLHGASGAVRSEDTVFLISKGGRTAEVNQFAAIAKSRGATLIVMTEDAGSELARLADAVIRIRIPAGSDPFGMVATASSLANAAAGDAICELILHECGYTVREFAGTHPGGAVGERIREEGMGA